MSKIPKYTPYKVKDLSLADWGRKEIELAEAEIPGLMALREEYGNSYSLTYAKGGIKIAIPHQNAQSAKKWS